MAIPSHKLSYVKWFKLCCVSCPSSLVCRVSEAVHTPLKIIVCFNCLNYFEPIQVIYTLFIHTFFKIHTFYFEAILYLIYERIKYIKVWHFVNSGMRYMQEDKKVWLIVIFKREFPEGAWNDHMRSVQEQANGYIPFSKGAVWAFSLHSNMGQNCADETGWYTKNKGKHCRQQRWLPSSS